MSKYTTGELAKLCHVSVRTVQYYDDRGILIPSELSEGGRRLYSDDDLKRMHVICFLRDIGLPLNSIAVLFAEENPENVISILLQQQEESLRYELSECERKLILVEGIKRELKEIDSFSGGSGCGSAREHGGFTVTNEGGTVCKTGDLTRFYNERTACKLVTIHLVIVKILEIFNHFSNPSLHFCGYCTSIALKYSPVPPKHI